jgi:rhodanese-related sulfurtransferase
MHLRRALLLAVICAIGLVWPAAAAEYAPMTIAGAKTVNADEIVALVNSTPALVIIDSRKPEDFASGAIEGAVLLTDTDMTQEMLARVAPEHGTPVLFYCNGVKCGRAAKAVAKAIEWGYRDVYYYALGIMEWDRLGLPLVLAQRTAR